MTIPTHLQAAMDRALAALARQQQLDPELVVSQPDADGRVQIEGTVNLATMLAFVRSHPDSGIQALGAAISRRNWHDTEVAHAQLRDAQ